MRATVNMNQLAKLTQRLVDVRSIAGIEPETLVGKMNIGPGKRRTSSPEVLRPGYLTFSGCAIPWSGSNASGNYGKPEVGVRLVYVPDDDSDQQPLSGRYLSGSNNTEVTFTQDEVGGPITIEGTFSQNFTVMVRRGGGVILS